MRVEVDNSRCVITVLTFAGNLLIPINNIANSGVVFTRAIVSSLIIWKILFHIERMVRHYQSGTWIVIAFEEVARPTSNSDHALSPALHMTFLFWGTFTPAFAAIKCGQKSPWGSCSSSRANSLLSSVGMRQKLSWERSGWDDSCVDWGPQPSQLLWSD